MYSRRSRRPLYVPRPIRYKTVKYSNETAAGAATMNLTQADQEAYVILTDKTDTQGVRKVKNFILSILTDAYCPFFFALIYVPEGIGIGHLNYTGSQPGVEFVAASLYEPNQNVLMSGIFGGVNGTVERFRSRLARNLNSGDRIILLIRNINADSEEGAASRHFIVSLNYAITY